MDLLSVERSFPTQRQSLAETRIPIVPTSVRVV